jgi:type I restriction enzyme R subunit
MPRAPEFRRRELPHWDMPGATFFVTSCLEGSIPARGLLDLKRYRAELAARARPADLAEDEWEARKWKHEFARREKWLDEGPSARWLERPALAEVVTNALMHFAGERYEVLALVVMPSHFHWVFRPRDEWVAAIPAHQAHRSPREQIMLSVKKLTARRCNELLHRQGVFWQAESYDHWVRDDDELERLIRYVEDNPVKAGLVKHPADWPYSSARVRQLLGLQFGVPIRGHRSPNLCENC